MKVIERIKLAVKILKDSPYQKQKERITKIFNLTSDNDPEDIMLRLIVIDSSYSTNMNKRYFGFEDLTKLIIDLPKPLSNMFNKFVEDNFIIMTKKIGINKQLDLEKERQHAFSLLTKYLYFLTKYEFPIYDSLVFYELKEMGTLKGPRKPSKDYFQIINKLLKKYTNFKIFVDDLDKYFWLCGKIRNGNLSLVLNREEYKEFVDKSKIFSEDMKKIQKKENKSKKDQRKIIKTIVESNFTKKKLTNIQELAKSLINNKFE
jgi:hypothetical protein